MARTRYVDRNLFSGANGASDGLTVGPSESLVGASSGVILALDNPGRAFVVLQRKRTSTDAHPNADWHQIGGGTNSNRQRFNLFLSGFEYRAYISAQPESGQAVSYSVHNLPSQFGGTALGEILASFDGANTAGFSSTNAGDLIGSGPYDDLLTTESLLFLCKDTDAELQAKFGGLWENIGLDMRKLGLYDEGVLLTDLINSGTGSTTQGEIGGAPVDRTGLSATLAAPTAPVLNLLTSTSGEFTWDLPSVLSGIESYEVVRNGIIVAFATSPSYFMSDLTAETFYDLSVRSVNNTDDTFSTAISASGTTAAGSGGGGSGSNGASEVGDGTSTTSDYFRIDLGAYTYADAGSGAPVQTITKETTVSGHGNTGYAEVTNSAVLGERSIAYQNNVPTDTSDRKMWARIQFDDVGDTFSLKSVQGTLDTHTTSGSTGTWVWVQFTELFKAFDSQLQLHGGSDGVLIDCVILTASANVDTPTGVDGFNAA